MNKRGALFFTLDTLIAGIILSLTIVLALNLSVDGPRLDDTQANLQNLYDYLMFTDMDAVGLIYEYDAQNEGVGSLKVHEQIHNLYINQGNETKANDFIRNIVRQIIPEGRGISYTLNNDTIFLDNQNVINPRINISMNLLTYYRYNDEVFGPNITRITIWY
ncbi:MAG: hypothetical protein ACMXX9_03450 [Candidatus Woesearchaeota archaeon]